MKRLLYALLAAALLLTACAPVPVLEPDPEPEPTPEPPVQILALDNVVALGEKGLSLSWGDFEAFAHEDAGSGLHIWKFPMAEPGYALSVEGNSLSEPPARILLTNEAGDSIEIRTEDVQAFLAGKSEEEPSPSPEPEPTPAPPKSTPKSTKPASSASPTPPASPTPSAEPSSTPQISNPTYTVVASPASYDVSAASITVKITNTSTVEGGYGYAYRIERRVSGKWESVPLNISWILIAAILPPGQTNTETFSLHQGQYDYQPGTYRIVFLEGLNGASATFTLSASAKPTYSVRANPRSYPASADSISVRITNTSKVEGAYGYAHRIDRLVNGKWESVPLNISWNDIAVILPPGQTNTEKFSLHQGQYDYQPGTYRIVFLDGLAGASATFTLT